MLVSRASILDYNIVDGFKIRAHFFHYLTNVLMNAYGVVFKADLGELSQVLQHIDVLYPVDFVVAHVKDLQFWEYQMNVIQSLQADALQGEIKTVPDF